jgi:spermidine synthase
MQAYETIEQVTEADGSVFALRRRGEEWVVSVNNRILMSSRMHQSEEELAALAIDRLSRPKHVFIGGLGLGYTLRAALDRLPTDARVTVAELVPAVVSWNLGPLATLAGRPLDDNRSTVVAGDALFVLQASESAFDAILLDVDNGPVALSKSSNQRLYSHAGVRKCIQSLRPGGVLAVWSAGPSEEFERRLSKHGRDVEVVSVTARKGARAKHCVFIARR